MSSEDSTLFIKVIGAANIIAADFNSSDPYVVIKKVPGLLIGDLDNKTPVKKNTLNPAWNTNFQFKCNYKLRKLVFELWDQDNMSKDDPLGKVKVDVEKLIDQKEHEDNYDITLDGKPAGILRLQLKLSSHSLVAPGTSIPIRARSIHLGLGWDCSKQFPLDLDATVCCLDSSKEMVDRASFNNLKIFNGAIEHQGDCLTGETKGDDEVVLIDLDKLPNNIEYLVFLINIMSGVSFTKVKSAYIRLLEKGSQKTLAFSRLNNIGSGSGLFTGVMKKNNGEWTFRAVQKIVEGNSYSQSILGAQKLL